MRSTPRRCCRADEPIIDSRHRRLPDDIAVLPGTDIDDLWDRFEIFEALHHSLTICNPMSSAELDEVVTAMQPTDGSRVLDVASGYGELLLRAADQARIIGTGIDLSPWMIAAAHDEARTRATSADLTWVLGEAREFTTDPRPDIAVCIGAEWIWHDFSGTARALSHRLGDGGVAVIGAPRLHHDADAEVVAREWGRVETVDDMYAQLARNGLTPLHRVDPDDAGWDSYLAATADAAARWAVEHPGPRAEQWVEEQADWQAARDRDRDVIGWSVWIARKSIAIA